MELTISHGPKDGRHPGLRGRQLPEEVLCQLWAENLRRQGSSWGRAVSHSMRPLIAEGDRVLVERIPREEVGFGDIVVFPGAGQLTVHRVLGRRRVGGREYFLEKGDHNFWAGLVPSNDVVGRVGAIETSGAVLWLTSRRWRLLQRLLALYSYLTWRWWTFGERVLPPWVRGKVQGRWPRRLCRLPPRMLLYLVGTRTSCL